jgi:hypothetical protein
MFSRVMAIGICNGRVIPTAAPQPLMAAAGQAT